MRWLRRKHTTFPVISVWGIAGVGKSALVRSIYHNQMEFEYSHRWSKYGWVNVSCPFSLREFSRSLLLELSPNPTKAKANEYFGMLSIEDPIQECRDILREHRCLVVIDDLQSMEEWESINTALRLGQSSRSRIIVITNKASVAKHCSGSIGYVHNIRSLEPDAALSLFKHQLTKSQSRYCELPEIKEQLELTLAKCGGLPKVIVALRGYMVTEGIEDRWNWRFINDEFMHMLENDEDFHGLQGLFVWMRSYFRTCPDYLKPCIFYLPIFPLNYNIRRRRLTRRWIAEGYSRDTVDTTAEENADMYLSKLVKLSIIQPITSFMKMRSCQVNGFFHEYIMSQPREDNLLFALEERCSQNSQRTGRHLVIGSCWDRDINVFESIDFSRLRSLTVFGEWMSFFISEKMKRLRVLDLEDTSGLSDGTSGISDDDLELIVKRLSRLKFLSLRGCTSITRLPTSLGNLRQLETLDVRHTSIVTLPPAVIKLHKLQYVRAGTKVPLGEEPTTQSRSKPCTLLSPLPEVRRRRLAHFGVEVPRGVGKLTALQTLGVVNVGVAGGKAILKELKNLTQLRKLGVSGINGENIQDFYNAISGHGHLESLSVRLDKDKQDFFSTYICQPPKTLRRLKLYGHVDKLPLWIKQTPRDLEMLHIEMVTLTQEIIDFLRDIKYLMSLRLCVKPIQDGEQHFCARSEGGDDNWNFRSVKVLEIDCSFRLRIVFGAGTMASLELLKVHCCSGSWISGLEHPQKLKEVRLMGSYDKALKEDLKRQLAQHPGKDKPVLKPEEPHSS